MTTLERAVEIAARAHAGQKDKLGEPYILHPLRVMLAGKTEEERIVGVLHDVLEDVYGNVDEDEAEEIEFDIAGFSHEIRCALNALRHQEGEPYPSYIQRVKAAGELAVKVKINDILDNLGQPRFHELAMRDPVTARRLYDKYVPALKELQR